MIRPDLDGLLFRDENSMKIWLVFLGRFHKIENHKTLDDLFLSPVIQLLDTTGFVEGDALQKGTCLVRSDHNSPIYFLNVSAHKVTKHLIKDFESFQEFGFALEKVKELPRQLLDIVPDGHDVTGAMSRVGRW